MKKIFLLAILAICVFSAKAQYVSLNNNELNKLKQLIATDPSAKMRFNELQKIADAALNEAPNPIDTIQSEGKLAGDPKKTATGVSLRDMKKMYALALLFRTSSDKKYLNKAVEYLAAWSKFNVPNGDPIDDTNLDQAVEAYDLFKNDIDAANNKLITGWLAQSAQMEINKFKPGRETSYNNWHSHRLKEIGEIGFAIKDDKFTQYAVAGIKEQIGKNLLPDGSSVDFKLRDALHYHVYDLEPLLKLAIIIKRATGVDYYNYVSDQQTSIKKSVEWLLPYLNSQKTHGEFVNSTVSFDKKRANNGEKDYIAGTPFNPKNGVGVLELAEYFFPDAIDLIQKLKTTDQNYPDWQLVLNKVKR
jgi:hypothetical protein